VKAGKPRERSIASSWAAQNCRVKSFLGRCREAVKNPCYTSSPFTGTDSFLARQLASLVKGGKEISKFCRLIKNLV
jgi:hypothetical protein